MVRAKQNTARKAEKSEEAERIVAEDVSAHDYANNMFRDGYNRVAHIRNGSAYDTAAHEDDVKDESAIYGDAEQAEQLLDSAIDSEERSPEKLLAMKQDTTRSRDGTEASGSLDESGGYLGGTPKEIEDLETTAMPVDKIPHMND